MGNLVLSRPPDQVVDFRHVSLSINEEFVQFDSLTTSARFVLVVEKECAFQKLVDEQFTQRFPDGILVTA